MKLNKSYLIAGLLFIVIAIWFIINNMGDEGQPLGLSQADIQAERLQNIPTVQIRSITARPHQNVISLFGQTEANREVVVKAQTASPVAATPIAEGRTVRRNALLCRQAVEARQARVDQARVDPSIDLRRRPTPHQQSHHNPPHRHDPNQPLSRIADNAIRGRGPRIAL